MHQKKCNLQNKSDSQPGHLSKCANNWSQDYPVSAEGFQFRLESVLLVPSGNFSEPPPEGGLDLVTNRQGAI